MKLVVVAVIKVVILEATEFNIWSDSSLPLTVIMWEIACSFCQLYIMLLSPVHKKEALQCFDCMQSNNTVLGLLLFSTYFLQDMPYERLKRNPKLSLASVM